jgi:hypothetical protein
VIIRRVFRSSHFGAGFFSGKVQFWQSQVSEIGAFSLVKSFGKFGSGWFVKIYFSGKVFFQQARFLFRKRFW